MNISNSIYNTNLSLLPLITPQNTSISQTDVELEDSSLSSNTEVLRPVETIIEPSQEIRQSMFDLRDKNPNKFLHSFNQEKIDKMVIEYKEKLLKQQASNPDSYMDIAYLTRVFKKGLQEKLVEISSNTSSSVQNFSQLQSSLSSKY